MIVVGVDENGLGPLLGPLVTTAVGFELSRYSPERQAALGRELGIDDSKATAGFGQMAAAEGIALALIEAVHGGVVADVDALLGRVLLDGPSALQRACPAASLPQCWSVPLSLPCFGGELEAGRAALRALAAGGVRVRHARSAVACTGALNERLRTGQSRVEVDLELMERLVLDARATVGVELRAICGMVGGIRNYVAKMRHFHAAGAVVPQRAQRGTLAYDVRGVGHVRFEIDADARHLPVALASMLGKYVRELWMERQSRFYRAHDAALGEASGYHDPVTRRFIVASEPLRRTLGVDEACFLRLSARTLEDERAKDDPQLTLL